MSSNMKKRLSMLGLLIILILIVVLFCVFKLNSDNKINQILMSDDYVYLNDAAKKYIKQKYYQSGVILSTEKNKSENDVYLNPAYVEYLNDISSGSGEIYSYDVIPSETIIDYVNPGVSANVELPSEFDLRNVDGKNFVTPIKDQDSTGLCWAFATNAQAESHLLVKSNTSYEKGVSKIFSEMQLDYATADNGIIDGSPLYSYTRLLGDGGRFDYIMPVMRDGLGLVDVSWRDFDTYDGKSVEKNKVYGYSNSEYEVTSSVNYPVLDFSELDLTNSEDVIKRENYINGLKQLIMENGGAYVSTVDPTSRCSISVNGSRLMYDDSLCASGGHAMQVIGWDDDFEYSFCSGQKDSYHYYYLGNSNNCSSGTVISGKGAWLIKNSWGTSVPYVYLAYDSLNSEFNVITGIDTKEWDNHYKLSYANASGSMTSRFRRNFNALEKVEKVKFETSKQDLNYSICVDGFCKTVETQYPGIYTADFSDSNITFFNEVSVKTSGASFGSLQGLYLYTTNINEEVIIETEDVTFKNKLTNINKYQLRISSETYNIPENDKLDYKILDQSNNEILVGYTYSENVVFANQVFSLLQINDDIEFGTYILQTIYNGKVYDESKIIINEKLITIDGEGTEENPYIINTPSQLNLMRLDRFSFYKLGQDIDLSYDTQNVNGLFYNDGQGWEPIRYSTYRNNTSRYLYFSKGFSGGFDGDGHTIKGLYINRKTEDGIGLFANTYNEIFSNLYIKNVILENPNITGRDYVGSLVGVAYGTTYERNLEISNIQVIGGSVSGNKYVGGVIGIANIGSNLKKYGTTQERHNLSNLYNSAKVYSSEYAGGIFGLLTNINGYVEGKSYVNLSNLLNKGHIISDSYAGGLVGYINVRDTNNMNINNSMNTGVIEGKLCSSNIVCYFDITSTSKLNLENIYYVFDDDMDFNVDNVTVNNVSKKTLSELKDLDNYSSWNSFSTYWKQETIEDIVRLPILKFMDFDYVTFMDVTVHEYEDLDLSYYIFPRYDAALNNSYQIIGDDELISISNNVMTGLVQGETKMHVINYYDGFEKNINVTVLEGNENITFTFESNGGTYIEPIVTDRSGIISEPDKPLKEGYLFLGWYLDSEFTIRYSFDMAVRGDITLYARWEEIVVRVSDFEIEDDLITGVLVDTTISDFVSKLNYNNGLTVSIYDNKDELVTNYNGYIGTGSKVKFYYNDNLVKKYDNVVMSDVDGDGQLKLSDIMKVANYVYVDNNSLDGVYLKAADNDLNGLYNLTDVMRLANKLYNS